MRSHFSAVHAHAPAPALPLHFSTTGETDPAAAPYARDVHHPPTTLNLRRPTCRLRQRGRSRIRNDGPLDPITTDGCRRRVRTGEVREGAKTATAPTPATAAAGAARVAVDTLTLAATTGRVATAMARPSMVQRSGSVFRAILMPRRAATATAVVTAASSPRATSSARTRMSPSGRPAHRILRSIATRSARSASASASTRAPRGDIATRIGRGIGATGSAATGTRRRVAIDTTRSAIDTAPRARPGRAVTTAMTIGTHDPSAAPGRRVRPSPAPSPTHRARTVVTRPNGAILTVTAHTAARAQPRLLATRTLLRARTLVIDAAQ